MSEEKQTRVNVTKADLPLQTGESVGAFTSTLREAVRAHLFETLKLKVDREKGVHADVWMNEVFSDQAIAEVNEHAPKEPRTRRFMAVPYSRSGNNLTLGTPVEVVRRVSYVPKSEVAVSVSKGVGRGVGNSLWVGAV